MKVSKKTGKVRLETGELMVDNRYFIKREPEHMKLSDLNFVFHVRVSRRIASGAWLENMWARAVNGDTAATGTLRTYMATLWSILTVVPDDVFVTDTLEAVDRAMTRRPEWYGLKVDATPEEETVATDGVREMGEFESGKDGGHE